MEEEPQTQERLYWENRNISVLLQLLLNYWSFVTHLLQYDHT
jgi:hypothetical protein